MSFRDCPLKDKDRLVLALKKKQSDCPGCYEKDDIGIIVRKKPCETCGYCDKEVEMGKPAPWTWWGQPISPPPASYEYYTTTTTTPATNNSGLYSPSTSYWVIKNEKN
jgi:hypothetical protein